MAINFNNRNQGIGTLDLSEYGLQQPEENMTVAEVFNTPQSLMEIGAVEPGSIYGYNLTDPGEALEDFRNSAVNFRNAPANSANTQDVQSQLNRMLGMPGLKGDVIKNKDFIQDAINKGFLKTPEDFKNQKSFANPDDLQAMAISNYDQLFGPKTMTDANQGLYTGMMDAKSGVPVGTSVGITDRNRGMPGAPTGAYEMIGGTPVAVGDVLGRQMALEKSNFYEEPTQGINLGGILNAAALFGGPLGFAFNKPALSLTGAIGNVATGRFGRAVDRAKSGLGSLGSKFAGKMRGINPVTGRPNTQSQYEAARTARQQQARTNRMIDRITSGKRTRSNPRDAGTTPEQKAAISAALQESRRGQQYTDKDSSGSGGTGGGKIVCTMMNERYGFGSFRNKIWMKFHENHGPEYQKGYHAIFLPLVKIAKGEGKINTAVRKVLEHMGRHVTADMFKIMKGKKRDTLGRIYRAIFEPTCHIIGKIKSALGRG